MDLFGPKLIDQYDRIVEVVYKDEKYLVRDNGAILRKKKGIRRSSVDEKWTFGRKHSSGYMRISDKYAHIIVAYAFHGAPPTPDKKYVDHKDTNKCNNRPENLEWVTWLENLLRNPLTRRRILNAWGSLDKFFENPNKFKGQESYKWMRPISMQEALVGEKQFIKWAKLETSQTDGYVNEFLASKSELKDLMEPINTDTESLSPLAVQRNWKTPAEFPNCPDSISSTPLEDYKKRLVPKSIFARDKFKESLLVTSEIGDNYLVVVTRSNEESPVKPWAVARISTEDGNFVHEAIKTCFDENGALNELDRLMGRPAVRESIENYL